MIDIESGRSKAIIEVNSLKDSRDFLDVRDAIKAYHVLLRDGINGKQYNIRIRSKTIFVKCTRTI